MNPHSNNDGGASTSPRAIVGYEAATVTTVPSHTAGDGTSHAIMVVPDGHDSPRSAEVPVDQHGDVSLPQEGDPVYVGYKRNGRTIVLGTRYGEDDSIPAFEEGERVIGHPLSDSHVRFAADGTLHVEGDDGNTIELRPDGTIVVNDGSNNPVTDIETSTDSDGHVTSISVTKSDDVYVP